MLKVASAAKKLYVTSPYICVFNVKLNFICHAVTLFGYEVEHTSVNTYNNNISITYYCAVHIELFVLSVF